VKKVGMQIFSTASSRSRQRKILHCHSRHFLSGIHLVFSQSTSIDRMERGTCVYPKHHVHQILCDAGFRHGEGGQTNSLRSDKACQLIRASVPTAERQASRGEGEQSAKRDSGQGPAGMTVGMLCKVMRVRRFSLMVIPACIWQGSFLRCKLRGR
jgi:hypothetical protein